MTRSVSQALPLEGAPSVAHRGWSVRLPVRREDISVVKQTVVYDRVLVTRHQVEQSVRIQTKLRREELRTDTRGDAEVTRARPVDAGRQRKPSRSRRKGLST